MIFQDERRTVIYECILFPKEERLIIIINGHNGLIFHQQERQYFDDIIKLWVKNEEKSSRNVSQNDQQFIRNICSNF